MNLVNITFGLQCVPGIKEGWIEREKVMGMLTGIIYGAMVYHTYNAAVKLLAQALREMPKPPPFDDVKELLPKPWQSTFEEYR